MDDSDDDSDDADKTIRPDNDPAVEDPDSSDVEESATTSNKSRKRITALNSDDSDDEGEGGKSDGDRTPTPTSSRRRHSSGEESDGGARGDSSDSEVETGVFDKRGRKRFDDDGSAKRKPSSRKSKMSAMDEIHAESCRMLRESAVALPYHRPKSRSLAEFLNRKKGVKEVVGDDIKLVDLKLKKIGEEEAEKIQNERERVSQELYASEEEPMEDEDDEGSDYDPDKERNAEGVELEHAQVESAEDPAASNENVETSEEKDSNAAQPIKEHEDEREEKQNSAKPDPLSKAANDAKSDANAEQESVLPENASESLHLELEQDTEKLEDSEEIAKSPETPKPVNNALQKKLALLAKLNLDSSVLQSKPKLGASASSADDDLVIEGGDSGKNLLKNRFVRHVKARGEAASEVKKDVSLTIVTKEVGGGFKSDKIHYQSDTRDLMKNAGSSARSASSAEKPPGVQRLQLKKALRDRIAEQRRLERAKKEEMKRLYEEERIAEGGHVDLGDDEPEEEILDDEEEMEESEEDEEEEPESETDQEDLMRKLDAKQEAKLRKRNAAFLEDEAEEEDENACKENEEEEEGEDLHLTLEEDDDDEEEEPDTLRVQTAVDEKAATKDKEAEEDDDMADTLVLESQTAPAALGNSTVLGLDTPASLTAKSLNVPEVKKSARKSLGFGDLLDKTDPEVNDISDVIGLCSGQFATQTQKQTVSQEDDPNEPDTLVLESQAKSHTEKQAPVAVSAPHNTSGRAIILDSDDEEENKDGNTAALSQRKKKRMAVVSDDSDSEEEEAEDHVDGDEVGEVEKEAAEVMYDSDENEIEVPKEDVIKKLRNKKG